MFILLALGAGLTPVVQAQPQDVAFEQVRLPGGYVSNFVNDMVQDRQGFLWLATRAWLIKYDGYETTTYRHSPGDPASLAASKWVETVYVDGEGTLWVGTYGGGLDRFDPASNTFTHFSHDPTTSTSISGDTVTVMLEDPTGTFWVGTHQGLNRMSRTAGTFTRFRHDPNDPTSLSNDQVRSLYVDRQGTLWVGTGSPWGSESPDGAGGLNRFDPVTETFTRYLHDPADASSLIDNHVTALFEDSRGTFWVGTAGDGLHSMDRQRGTFTRHRHASTDPTGPSMPHLDEFTGPAYVSDLYEDESGALWIGAINGGLSRYDPATGHLVQYENSPGVTGTLGTTTVSGIMESREGTRWVTSWDGLFKVVERQTAFEHHSLDGPDDQGATSVKAVLKDRAGTLWIGTETEGLLRVDAGDYEQWTDDASMPRTRYRHDPDDPQSLSDNSVLSLHEDREGVLWIGTAVGLDRMDRERGRFLRYQHDSDDPNTLGAGPVFSISDDRRGTLWVGVYGGGLSRLDRKTGRVTRYEHDPATATSLSDNDVVAVHEDRDGLLWIGTLRGGLNRFDPASGRFTRYPYHVTDSTGLSDGFVTSIYEDAAGTLWIGTHLGGLNRLDRRTGHVTHFTTANSALPDNRVTSILEDEAGDFWLSTGNGTGSTLTRFDPDEGQVHTYDPGLILPSGTAPPGSFEDEAGTLMIGGDNGFVTFSPRDVVDATAQNSRPPQVVLTGLRLFNRPVTPEMENALNGSLWERKVRLPHDQNAFSLDYVGLHFDDPATNRYEYMLEGYDETWRPTGTERTASYYKVPPGQYVFRVNAANADGIWTEDGTSLQLTILPPWWRTWWAYVGYALFLIGGVFVVDRVQRRRIREVERRRATIREAHLRAEIAEEQSHHLEALDAAKSRFFANISHEFRTPLTLLLGPLGDALDGATPPDRLMSQVPSMYRSTGRLLRLVQQLLDLAKLEAGSMDLQIHLVDLTAFLRDLVLGFAPQAERQGLTLLFETEDETLFGSVDRDKLEKIVSNLLSNALKFTPSGGKICVDLTASDDTAGFILTVSDTGVGIPADDVAHVFDRFHQVDSTTTREHEGTGIGLALVKELVGLHHGTIAIDSVLGFGTTVTVQFPGALQEPLPDSVPTPARSLSDLRLSAAALELASFETGAPDRDTTADTSETRSAEGTVLVVDDNADVRTFVSTHLAGHHHILEAGDGEEGLALIRRHHPDLVISDVMMPKLDGYALCRAVKADDALCHIPVILLTAKAEEADVIYGLESGAHDYLTKPFSVRELEVRVANTILSREHLRQVYSGRVLMPSSDVMVSSEEAAFMQRVLEVMTDCLGDSTFSTDRLGDEVGLSRRQVERKVKAITEQTPPELMRHLRLERAAQILEARPGSIAEVAYAVGFKSPAHFSATFRKVYGHSPSEHVENAS